MYFPSLDNLLVLVSLSIAITVLFDLVIFRFGSIARNVVVIGLGGALGIFFGFSIPSVECRVDFGVLGGL